MPSLPRIPDIPNCDVCGRSLSLRRIVHNMRRKPRELVWTMRLLTGETSQRTVQWLCGSCQHDYDKRRSKDAAAGTEAAESEPASD